MKNKIKWSVLLFFATLSLLAGCFNSSTEIGPDGRKYILFSDGSPKKAYQISSDLQPTGWVTEWYPNGTMRSDYFLEDSGVKTGLFREWDEQGRLIRTGEYLHGERVNTWSGYSYVGTHVQKQRRDTLLIAGKPVRNRLLLWNIDKPGTLSGEITDELIGDSTAMSYKASWYESSNPNSFRFSANQEGFYFLNGYHQNGSPLFVTTSCNSVTETKNFEVPE